MAMGSGRLQTGLQDQFGAAASGPGRWVRSELGLAAVRRISVAGRWDAARQFLLDNRTRDGRAGYEVLTPLQLDDGRWLIVNRGWVSFSGYRERLPDIAIAHSGSHWMPT